MSTLTTTTPESRAQLAYTAYGKAVDFRNKDGDEMPPWHELPEAIQAAWVSAAGVIWDLATTGHATM